MELSGIVRRLDDLGRLVIPKEMRDRMGIGKNEEMQITVDEDRIILRKFSAIKNLKSISDTFCEQIARETGSTVNVFDREKFVSATSNCKRFEDQPISDKVKEIIEANKSYIACTYDNTTLLPLLQNGFDIEYECQLIYPIMAQGICAGGIMIVRSEHPYTETDIKIVKFASAMFGQLLLA